MNKEKLTLTFQTRFVLEEEGEDILSECACLFNKVERSLFAETVKGKNSASCKNDFLKKYGITARQFNACRVSLEGKIAACRVSQEQRIQTLKQQIKNLQEVIDKLANKPSKKDILHQKKRRLTVLTQRFISLESDLKKDRVHLCFGGKKLFHSQFHRDKAGFSSHEDWKKAWEAKRNSEFFVLGSKDETAGNQTCIAKTQGNNQISLKLRLPNVLIAKYGKYLEIKNISIKYGYDKILASLNNPEGQAISYRFKKDEKSWRLFISTDIQKQEQIYKEGRGVIGIDLNSDHIAFIETDRFGNPIVKKVYSWISYGKNKHQLKALTGDICKKIVDEAIKTQKPIVLEKLDFKNKKLLEKNKKISRLLSSFAYSLFINFLKSRAFREGISVYQVNPAYTSIIGCINYAIRYGLSSHLAAALCIARRYQKFSETPCSPVSKIPDGKGHHVTFVLPERNRTKHVWSFWGQVKKKLITVLAAHFRARNRSLNPLLVDS